MNALRFVLVLSVALALGGCAVEPTGHVLAEAGAQPTRAQAEATIRAHLKRALRDPESLKDFAMVSGPDLLTGLTAGGSYERAWLVCVEYNAKNAFGGYTGLATEAYPLRFSGDSLVVVSRINWVRQDKNC